jgi:uncharacterized HAD superfamily protein
MQSIAFDLDGTLVDLMAVFKRLLKSVYNIDYDDSKQTRFHVNVDGLTDTQIRDLIWQSTEAYATTPIYPGVPELMKYVYKLTDQPIKIITNRPIHVTEETYRLVKRFCHVPFELVINYRGYPKSIYLNGYDMYVEDRRANALHIATAGKVVFLIDRPWNQFETDLPIFRINDIREINTLMHSPQVVTAVRGW